MDSSHIHPSFRHVLGLSDRERLAFLNQPRWIGYKRGNKAIETLKNLMDLPTRPRMPNLLIVGHPNNGKTTIIRRFHDLYGESYVNEDAEPVKPVVITEAPTDADEKALYIAILERFCTVYRATDPKVKLRYQVVHLMRACHVRILIIDEIHSLLSGTAIKQREIMNAIKFLCNELAIPIIGVGTRAAIQVLHHDPQHASRFEVFSLPNWELDREFQKLLTSFERILPLRKPSNLHQVKSAKLLYNLSQGNLGELHNVLVACAAMVIKSGQEFIDEDIINANKWYQRSTQGIREAKKLVAALFVTTPTEPLIYKSSYN